MYAHCPMSAISYRNIMLVEEQTSCKAKLGHMLWFFFQQVKLLSDKKMTLNVKFLGCVLSFYLVTALYAFFYILRTHNSAQFHQQHPDIEDKNTLLIPGEK